MVTRNDSLRSKSVFWSIDPTIPVVIKFRDFSEMNVSNFTDNLDNEFGNYNARLIDVD